jgi:hypothetical protein
VARKQAQQQGDSNDSLQLDTFIMFLPHINRALLLKAEQKKKSMVDAYVNEEE